MTATEHASFLGERRTGIGGSDIASVFGIGYGCRLRLWRRKRGEEPDFPFEESGPMELGHLLEPYFATHYARITRRQVEERGVARHPDYPELLVHVDRMIRDPERGDKDLGVLEIKSVGRDVFYKIKREGLPEDYVLQLQHGMLVTGAKWGAFAIGSRNDGVSRDEDLLYWDVDRNEDVCRLILDEGPVFWSHVENGPAPDMLSPDDSRCRRCEFRVSCQGAALAAVAANDKGDVPQDESMRPLLLEFDERSVMADQAEAALNEIKEQIRTTMGDRTGVKVGRRSIYYRPQTSLRWDTDSLSDAYCCATGTVDYDGTFIPAPKGPVAKEFKRRSDSRPLRVY